MKDEYQVMPPLLQVENTKYPEIKKEEVSGIGLTFVGENKGFQIRIFLLSNELAGARKNAALSPLTLMQAMRQLVISGSGRINLGKPENERAVGRS